jgi:hypothetical protein
VRATAKKAKDWQVVKGGELPLVETLYQGKFATLLRLRYQLAGSTHNWHHAWADPTIVSDARGWLEARLGPLAGFDSIRAEVAGGSIALDIAPPGLRHPGGHRAPSRST